LFIITRNFITKHEDSVRILRFDDPQDRKALLELFTVDHFQADRVARTVRSILEEVRNGGDAAVLGFIHKYDGMILTKEDLPVPPHVWQEARAHVNEDFVHALAAASRHIISFHERQCKSSWAFEREGVKLRQKIVPLSAVGIYVPGGRALYPSTVLMLALPARLAGVKRIVMVTPPHANGVNQHLLVAAQEAGVTEIYQVGGVHAIAALAFGTETIAKVDKIVGPGNTYVTAAKRQVYGMVDIDNLAGPAEIAILADESANEEWLARDLIAQLEHDNAAKGVLITTSAALAQRVVTRVKALVEKAARAEIVDAALQEGGAAVLVQSLEEGVAVANAIAPQHLQIMTAAPHELAERVTNAGCVYLGDYSPAVLGDYIAGTNHTLPAGHTARFGSPLGVMDFCKRLSLVEYSREAFHRESEYAELLAEIEDLRNHAEALRARREKKTSATE